MTLACLGDSSYWANGVQKGSRTEALWAPEVQEMHLELLACACLYRVQAGACARLDGREVIEKEDARQLVAGGHIALLEVLRHRVLVGDDGAVADVLVDRGHDLRAAAARLPRLSFSRHPLQVHAVLQSAKLA